MNIKIKRVKIKAFRGFTKEKEFDFAPVTIFFGPNATGKSSTLNAIEWCFWGEECLGKDTGIRERIGWEIKNRNTQDNPFVEIEFENGEKILRVFSVKDKKSNLEISESYNLDISKSCRNLLNKYSFNDFLVGVYQHQEVIRAILTQEPRIRNEGFDRLFGLSEYREILDALQKAFNKHLESYMEDEISRLQDKIKAEIDVWNTDIKRLKEELREKGVGESDFSRKGEDNYKEKILASLGNFIRDLFLQPSKEFQQLTPQTKTKEFVKIIKSEITKLRSEMPDVKKLDQLYEKRDTLKHFLNGYNSLKNSIKEKEEELKDFIKKNGRREEIEDKKNKLIEEISKIEKEKEQRNLQGSIIEKAIAYLEKEGIDKNICPVCGNKTDNLLEHLKKEWEERYRIHLEELDRKLKSREGEKKNIEELIKKLDELEWEIKRTKERLNERIKDIGEKIKREIKEDEDPEALLNNELKSIEEKLVELKKKVQEKQKVLNEIEEKCVTLEKIGEILEKEERREMAREIEKTDEWKKMVEKKKDLIRLKEKLDKIILAIKQASQEEVKTRIEGAASRISDYFNEITCHPQIKRIQIKVKEDDKTGMNDYKIEDDSGKAVVPVLSQGNLNALALSIFLALCENLPFEFIMLDDPSQSLSFEEKERFVRVLDKVSQKKNIIIATMDNELFDNLLKIMTKTKKVYIFEGWHPIEGPKIKREN